MTYVVLGAICLFIGTLAGLLVAGMCQAAKRLPEEPLAPCHACCAACFDCDFYTPYGGDEVADEQ